MSGKDYLGVEVEYVVHKKSVNNPLGAQGTTYSPITVAWRQTQQEIGIKSFKRSSDYVCEDLIDDGIRTADGYKLGLDRPFLEAASVPIPSRLGCASDVVNNILCAEQRLSQNTDYGFSRHSTHISVSNTFENHNFELFKKLTAPLMDLLVGNPLSEVNVYTKEGPDRLQMRGDGVPISQLCSAVLLLQATKLEIARNNPPLIPNLIPGVAKLASKKLKSREDSIPMSAERQPITGQDYLNLMYDWLKPSLEQIGTSAELEGLRSFVSGNAKLVIDSPHHHSLEDTLISPGSKIPKLSNENRLLGSFVNAHKKGLIRLYKFSWQEVHLRDENDWVKKIEGISQIYEYGETLLDKLG